MSFGHLHIFGKMSKTLCPFFNEIFGPIFNFFEKLPSNYLRRNTHSVIPLDSIRGDMQCQRLYAMIKEDLSADPESKREEPVSELLQYLGNAAKLTTRVIVQALLWCN